MNTRDAATLIALSLFYWLWAALIYRHIERSILRYGLASYFPFITALIAGAIIGAYLGAD